MSKLEIRRVDSAEKSLVGNIEVLIDGVKIEHVEGLQFDMKGLDFPRAVISFTPTDVRISADVLVTLKSFIDHQLKLKEGSDERGKKEGDTSLPPNDM